MTVRHDHARFLGQTGPFAGQISNPSACDQLPQKEMAMGAEKSRGFSALDTRLAPAVEQRQTGIITMPSAFHGQDDGGKGFPADQKEGGLIQKPHGRRQQRIGPTINANTKRPPGPSLLIRQTAVIDLSPTLALPFQGQSRMTSDSHSDRVNSTRIFGNEAGAKTWFALHKMAPNWAVHSEPRGRNTIK